MSDLRNLWTRSPAQLLPMGIGQGHLLDALRPELAYLDPSREAGGLGEVAQLVGDLVGRYLVAHEGPNFLVRPGLAVPGYHAGANALPQHRVGRADDTGLLHPGMLAQQRLDLVGV